MIADVRIALGFLTRTPGGRADELDAARFSRAALWFPAVGLLVGGVAAATHALAAWATTGPAATVLALAAAVVVTGGLHEDGLADSADALGAHTTRERRLEILDDPRIGTFGALALILAFALSATVLAPLDGERFARTVLVAHVLARWSTLPQSLVLPPARTTGSGALLRTNASVVCAGTVYVLGFCLVVAGVRAGLVVFGVAAAVTGIGGFLAYRVFGGVSGDTFGAVNKLVEVAACGTLAASV